MHHFKKISVWTPPVEISLLPRDRIVKRVLSHRLFLSYLGIRKKFYRRLRIHYWILDNRLTVSFQCPWGYRLYTRHQQHKAEKFLGKNISISRHVGKEVVTVSRRLITRLSCTCGFRHSIGPSLMQVRCTKDQARSHIKITRPEWSTQCLDCPKQLTVTVETVDD